jgi:glycine/D-amino acid oxidase-like deaminating enzyme
MRLNCARYHDNYYEGPTIQLHTKGFDLIEKVAKDLEISSYRKIPTLSVSHRKNNKKQNEASWLDKKASSSLLDDGESTAQICPYEITTKMLDFAIQSGYAELMIGNAQGIITENSKINGVKVNNSIISCSNVCICMGPWSGVRIYDWFQISIPMDGIKSTSLVYNINEIKTEPYACFCDDDEFGTHLELYPRPNGDLYICGIGGSDYVNGDRLLEGGDCESADLILADINRTTAGINSFKSMSSLGDKYKPIITQACMRPCTSDSLPAMGKLNIDGAFVSTAHNCWGILWSCISGLAMSELIIDGHSQSIDLNPFNPLRFMQQIKNRGKKIDGQIDVGEQW